MLDSILTTAVNEAAVSLPNLILCMVISLLMGVLVALTHMFQNTYTKGFIVNLVLMPLIVQSVIMLVNGNLGTGMAVLGAFSLVRFRSIPGSAREIGSIFLSMAVGLATGMGYIYFAVLLTVCTCLVNLVLTFTEFGETKMEHKELKITIPEDLDYSDIFDDLFQEYTTKNKLVRVRTKNVGSLYELCYHVTLQDMKKEKQFIDQLRCRNGNLEIVCGRMSTVGMEL